jgi:hypothetical protein
MLGLIYAAEETTILESLIGVDIPDFYLWIVVGVVALIIVILILKGFVSELRKNKK